MNGQVLAVVPKPRQPLIRALQALIVAALVGPAVLIFGVALQDWQQLRGAAAEQARTTAALLREHALKVFQTHELVLERVDDRIRSLSWDEIDRSEELHRDLVRYTRGIEHISTILLVRPDGDLSNNTRRFPLREPVNVADRDYFLAPRNDTSGLFIGERFTGRVSGEAIINVSRRRSTTVAFDGVVAVAVFIDYFDRFYKSAKANDATSISLVRADGRVLVREPAGRADATHLSPRSGLLRAAAQDPTGMYETVSELDGVWRVHGYEKIGPYPLFVSYGVSLSAVQQEWLRNLAAYGLFAALASLGLATIACVALRQARREQVAIARFEAEVLERKSAEALYRNLYNRAPIPQQSLDEEGVLLNVSDAWLERLGYGRTEVIGQPLRVFLAEEYRERFDEQRMRLMHTGAVRDVPLEVLTKSGERVPVLWSGSVERDAAGTFVKTLGALLDITERRRAEQQLVHYQKMEAIGQLVAGMGHDFNNLLQAIGGCLRLIGRRNSDSKIATYLEAGQQAVTRGAKLTQQLMTFARREALRLEPLDIPEQVLALSELLGQTLRADIELHVSFTPKLWPVLVDPTQFEVTLLNLAANARDAMPDGGRLTLSAENHTLGAPPRADGLSGEFVCLSIADTGSGMPPEVLARAFDPFFTTKERGKGTGLGLSQVYGFARQCGGAVDLDSAPGGGTRVHLLLPRAHQAPPKRVAALNEEASLLRGVRVLLVEDDPIVAATVAAALEDIGCAITRAASGDAALTELRSRADLQVLFSDIVMPGSINGIELAKLARTLYPQLPIILTTGYTDESIRLEGVRVLPKPYTIEALVSVLAAVVEDSAAAY